MKKQRLGITCILAILMIMSTFLHPVQADRSFTNNIPGWAADAVNYLVEKGVIHGYSDGTFKPYKAITRAQTAVFIHRSEVPSIPIYQPIVNIN